MRAAGGDWGIVGVSLRSPDVRDRLAPQDHVYTAVEMSRDAQHPRVVEVLSDVIFAPADPDALLNIMADPAIRVVTLTITEKGYCYIPSTGKLDAGHPDILRDRSQVEPHSAVGFLVRALERRRAAGHRPFTVLSCDNLPENGCVARSVVVGFARMLDADLAEWIAQEGRFPSTMVDRIVPATTPENIESLARQTGRMDAAPVFHEPFLQWVIEDSFVDADRPQFETVPGLQLVNDVAPFELMKIRMLNGTHSALAYLGYLAGHETIAETVADPVFRSFVERLWRAEIVPTLAAPEGVDLTAYANALLDRYVNPAIRHRTWQIAMDGSQKLPQRLLGTLADNRAAGRACPGLLLSVAAWMRYVGGTDEAGKLIDVRDPLAARLRALSDAGQTVRDKVNNLLSVEEIFGRDTPQALRHDLATAYQSLADLGARRSIKSLGSPS